MATHHPPTQAMLTRIDDIGHWLAPLGLRVLLAWEFFEAGFAKLHGQNWFAEVNNSFPPPFSHFDPGINWAIATWSELIFSIALLLGFGTRYAAAVLWVLTVVAIHTVHWPAEWSSLAELWQGYSISDEGYGNYKLPLLYLAMLLPLALRGGGRLSIDYLIRSLDGAPGSSQADATAWGIVITALGVTTSVLLPWLGAAGAAAGLGLWATTRHWTSIRRSRSAA